MAISIPQGPIDLPGPFPEKRVTGSSSSGTGVLSQSNFGVRVWGQSFGDPALAGSQPISDGVLGEGKNGVHGRSLSPTDSGVWGENTGSGYGVAGSSAHGNGVIGLAAGAPRPAGIHNNGVIGITTTATDSGVWGANTGSGYGVAGSSEHGNGVIGLAAGVAPPAGVNNNGVIGVTTTGNGVIGLAAGVSPPLGVNNNGVIGVTNTATDSGVWGNNAGSGYGVAGSSAHGNGVIGLAAGASRPLDVNNNGVIGVTNTGNGVIGLAAGASAPLGVHNNGVIGVTNTATDSGVWGNNAGSGFGVAGSSTNGIGVLGQGGHLAGRFEGDVEVTGDIRLINQDCAEDFDIACADEIEPGTVMVITTGGTLRESQRAYDNRVAGVVSGAGSLQPGVILGRQKSTDKRLPISLLGKVYGKINANCGSIEVGDLLTTSQTPGHAMKASDRARAFGAVIGKALRPLKAGQGIIPILIALQ
jgi:hypothetical protein